MALPEPVAHHIEVSRTARYYTIGEIGATISDLWIVLHGYGKRAVEIAQPFRAHRADKRLMVFPEGMSRFYRSHRERKIGASWMTADDRKMEIRDYVRYLNRLHQSLVDAGISEGTRLTVFGFSQGSATASRWLAAKDVKAQRLILWGGLPAFELCTDQFQQDVPVEHVQLVTGTNDEYASPDRCQKMASLISKNGREIECIIFEGPHEIDSATLASLIGDETNRS